LAASRVAIPDSPLRTLACSSDLAAGVACSAATTIIPLASGGGGVAAVARDVNRVMVARTGTSGSANDGLFEYVLGATGYQGQWAQLAGQNVAAAAGASAWAGVAGSFGFDQVYAAQTAAGTGKLYRAFGQP
jgi:hypothetical protein